MKCIKLRKDDYILKSIKEVIRDEKGDPKEFIESKNQETFPFLDLIFPIMTRIAVSNYYKL